MYRVLRKFCYGFRHFSDRHIIGPNKLGHMLTPLDWILEVTVRDPVETPGYLDLAVRSFPQALESNVEIGHDSFLTNHIQGPVFCDMTPYSPLKKQLRFRMNISPPSSGSRNKSS
jgi:hypothetical protein